MLTDEEKTERKRQKEIRTVKEMIRMYCTHEHGGKELCPECAELYAYAKSRSEHCPFMANKTFCANCTVHCYKPEMREKIRKVMRYAGPRMIFYHPCMAVWHLYTSKREKARLNRKKG